MFLKPFVNDMDSLYNNGVVWTDENGMSHITKCIVLMSCLDSVARAMVQGIKQYNGKFGCGFCLHPGKRVEKGKGTARVYPITFPTPPKRTFPFDGSIFQSCGKTNMD